jgi:hypothetical protein
LGSVQYLFYSDWNKVVALLFSLYWIGFTLFFLFSGGMEALAESFSKHFFALGAGLFFISRQIALYGSALKAGLVPEPHDLVQSLHMIFIKAFRGRHA